MSLAHQIVSVERGPSLVKYEAACRALAEANSVDEVKGIRDSAEAMRAYARQAKNKQLEIDASEIRFRAERRIGELMEAQKNSVGLSAGTRGSKIQGARVDERPTLAEAGIDKHLADRARKYAAIPEDKFETILSERRERIEQENDRATVSLLDASKHVRGTFGTGENEWYTPVEYIDAARAVLGQIDLDPASSRQAQSQIKALSFFTASDSGLDKDWHGNVWLNPPFAQPLIADFVSKMVSEFGAGRVTAAVMLTHNYTDTAWFHEAVSEASAICFTRGRVKFYDVTGAVAAPTQGQAFFYFGHDIASFAKVFADIGFVVEVRR